MSWDGFKHILGNYPGIKVKFNNYLNNHASNVAWRAKTQPEQVREFITEFLEGFDDPGVRAKEACDRALAFRQKSNMPTGTYLEIKEMQQAGVTTGFLCLLSSSYVVGPSWGPLGRAPSALPLYSVSLSIVHDSP